MPVAAIAGVGSALIGASSASKAAKAQSRASDQQLALQERMYDQTREDLGGYRDAGDIARQAYMHEMGLGPAPVVGGTAPQIETITTPGAVTGAQPRMLYQQYFGKPGDFPTEQTREPDRTTYRVGDRDFGTLDEAQAWAQANPTGGTAYGGFTATPGYGFRVQSGNDSINALAGARGGLMSGRTLQDLATFNQNIASDEYGGYMNRLAGLVDMGSTAAAGQAGANNAFAQQGSNSLAQRGNATAAGAIGVGNAINSGIQTGVGLWQYQNALAQPAAGFSPTYSGWRP